MYLDLEIQGTVQMLLSNISFLLTLYGFMGNVVRKLRSS